jgi:hypothetical protein
MPEEASWSSARLGHGQARPGKEGGRKGREGREGKGTA